MSDNLSKKLINIQKALKAPKSNTNSFGNYKYRSAEDILEAVKPLVHAEGLSLTLTDQVVNVGQANYVKATALLSDGVQEPYQVSAYAREAVTKKGMDDAQITGSASSYARKYALSGLFAIDDTKDPDGHDNREHVSKPKPKVDELAKAKDNLNKLLEEYGHTNTPAKKVIINKVLEKSTVETEKEADEVIQALEDGLV